MVMMYEDITTCVGMRALSAAMQMLSNVGEIFFNTLTP
jgi:hypothetical protein